MKILCFTDGFNQGGAERQLVGLANLLQKKGYDVTLASYHSYNFYHPLMVESNLKYHFIECGDSQFSKLFACYKYFKASNFDWIISYKGGSNQICCILKALGMSYKLLVSERCLVYNHNSYQKKKFFLYRFADKIIPNSDAQKQFISKHYPHFDTMMETITNFTDTEHFSVSNKLTHNDKFRILVTARLSKQKNIERFILAIKEVSRSSRNIQVDWFGNTNFGEEEYAQKCKQLVVEYELSDIFSFHSATSNIRDEYQRCDVFCLPSLFEGYPNVICEAMSCGKPILCSDVCDNSTIIEDKLNGYLFNPQDIDDMALKINTMIDMPKEHLEIMGQESRRIALERFSQENFVNKYIKIIES